VRRRVAWGLAVALTALALAPATAQARGQGWKDFLIGAGLGTALGTAMGGATTLFVEPQKLQDATFQYHYGIGAGIGLIVGATGGALVGWLPSPLEGEEDDGGDLEVVPRRLAPAPPARFEMPLLTVQAVEVDEARFEKAYFLYPVRLSF
jgi:hypothetical protein